jgi:hypothetical protein
MSMISHLMALAAGVAGVTLYQRARQSGALAGGTGNETDGHLGRLASGGTDRVSAGMSGSAGNGNDSPNAAERMSAQGLGQGPMSDDGPEGQRSSENLFGSNSSSGSQAGTPGIPDMARGA